MAKNVGDALNKIELITFWILYYYDYYNNMKKYLCHSIKPILYSVLFLCLFVTLFVSDASFRLTTSLKDGAMLTSEKCNYTDTCMWCDTVEWTICFNEYDCSKKACLMTPFDETNSFTTIIIPHSDNKCVASFNFSDVWSVEYYRVAIVTISISLALTLINVIILFLMYCNLRLIKLYTILYLVSSIFLVVGFGLGIFGGAKEIHNDTQDYFPTDITLPQMLSHISAILTFVIITFCTLLNQTKLSLSRKTLI